MMHLLRSVRLQGETVDVLVDGAIIAAVGRPGTLPEAESQEIDLSQSMVFPGFTDMQVNGSFGHDFVSDPASIWKVGARLPEFGVTAFLPTVITASDEQVEAVLAAAANPPEGYRGAAVTGVHAEGPFLAESRKGAHDGTLIQRPDVRPAWLESSQLRMMTLAPEKEHAGKLIESLVARGVLVAAGHTEATAEEVSRAMDQGLRYGTHLYSAMSGLHHRSPGAAAALLVDERATCGVIADGIHMRDVMLNLAWRMKGRDGINLVSDAAAPAGMPEGKYQLGGFEVYVRDGAVRLEDGTLAGSSLTLDVAVRYLKKATGCTWEDAVHTVTTVPARLLGMSSPEIAAGAPATLTCLDQNGFVVLTMIKGEIVYRHPA